MKQGNNDFYYKNWGQNEESLLLLHFPYVNNGLEMNLCDALVDPLSYAESNEKAKTHVEMTYSNDPGLQHFIHESWIVRMEGRHVSDRILWFFLVSCNLTLPSWVPLKFDENTQRVTNRYNLECGVLIFEHGDPNQSRFSQNIKNHIRVRMKPSDHTTLTTVKCNLNKSLVPSDIPDLVDNPRLEGYGEVPRPYRRNACQDFLNINGQLTTWHRFLRAKECLKYVVLPGLVGTHNIIASDLIKYSYFMRWALYDYIFNDLAKNHPVGRLGVYDWQTTKKYFLYQLRDRPFDHPWQTAKNARVTLAVLVDIFVRWSIAFDAYDPRLNISRPEISERTLITLHEGRPGEQIVEHAQQQYREGYSTYDSLTMLMQSMHSSSYLWWKCPKGHGFYWAPKNIMMKNSDCPVCSQYHDIKTLYEILQKVVDRQDPQNPKPAIKFLTMEFPLLRKLKLDHPTTDIEDNGEYDEDEDDDEDEDEDDDDDDDEDEKQDDDDAPPPLPKKKKRKDRQVMKYDIFFLLDDQYVGAIEFDDESHNRKAQNAQPVPLIANPVADAIKNVLSSAMGIHLMRIWTGKTANSRPNAESRLQVLVDEFIKRIRSSRMTIPATVVDFQNRVRNFHVPTGLSAKYLLSTTLDRNPRVAGGFGRRRVPALPVSLIFSTDLPESSFREPPDELLGEMRRRGGDHPCLKGGRVKINEQIDDDTIRGYYQLLKEWRYTPEDGGNDDWQPDFQIGDGATSYRGRLFDGFKNGYNKLALMGLIGGRNNRNRVIRRGYYLETTRILPWKMVPSQ